jgi:hypothetical protein
LATPLKKGLENQKASSWTHAVVSNPVRRLYSMDLIHKSDKEILKVAGPIMDNLMEASTDIDHERHVRDFTERLKSLVTKEYLEKVWLQYQAEKGFFSKRECIAIFRRPASVAIVWKQWFTKQQGEFVAEYGIG